MRADYRYEEVLNAYRQAGVQAGLTVLVECDLACFGAYETQTAEAVCSAHFEALRASLGSAGTIVVPTTTGSLAETGKAFDPLTTPSEWGIFSEYVRRRPGTVRSLHPYSSYAANGPKAKHICGDVGRSAYGRNSPLGHLLQGDVWFLSVGYPPVYTPTVVHQLEVDMLVPYRYCREYVHPVKRDGRITKERFYRYVWYYSCNVKKDKRKLWAAFSESNPVFEARLGRGSIWGYSMSDMYTVATRIMKDDPYFLVEGPPDRRPYAESM